MEPTEFRRKSIAQQSLFKPHPLRQATFKALFSATHRRHWAGGLAAAGLICLAPPAAGQVLELSDLNGRNGFKINGVKIVENSGTSVSRAGDINDDGVDDLIIGARGAGNTPGKSYVVFGNERGFDTPFELSILDGTNGFKLNSEAVGSGLGRSVAAAGDVNDDGIDDLLVGAPSASQNGVHSGASYVVFGSDQGFSTPLDLSSLDGTNGFRLNGESAGDNSGFSVSAAGDVNGDGIADIIIGAYFASTDVNFSGASYVVFGSDQGFSTPLELSMLDGGNGFKLNGVSDRDRSGRSVSGAGDINGDGIGDVNGDGIDDIIIGAPRADPKGLFTGTSYVIFGSPTAGQIAASPMLVNLGDINSDGSEDIAALVHDLSAQSVTATVKNVEYGSSLQQISFNGNLIPVAFKLIAD